MDKTNLILNSTIELVDVQQEGNGKGRPFISRFIEPGIAHYKELGDILITKETLNKFIHTMIGCPVIIEHEDVTDANADKLRVGVVSRVWFNEMDGYFYCEGILTDPEAIDLVKNQGYNVSCAYSFVSDNTKRTHNGKEIDMEFIDGEFLHLALVKDPRYEGANIVVNSEDKVNNGWITLDEVDENGERKKIWIPENVHYVKPSERKRVLDICDNYKQGDATIYNFEHTRVKPTENQINYLKSTVKEINDIYAYKGIAQIEISSSLNSGSWGVCFAPSNTSLISIAPAMYKENAQKKYDESVKSGFHPKGTGEAIKSVLVHEIAHAITCNSKDNEFWGKIDKIRSEYLKKIKNDDISNPDFISNYARVNRYEFVAEAFCQGHLSKKYGKYTKEVMELMNEHFSKTKQLKLFNSKKEENNDEYMWIEGFGYGYPIDENDYEEFKNKLQSEKEKVDKKNKTNNSIGDITMTVLNDLKDFIKSVVSNEKEEEMKEVKNEDKRKLIDEVGGILKGKVDEELWRTVIGKLEKVAYEPSEDNKADNEDDKEKEAKNKCKNEEDEEPKEDVTKNEDKPEDKPEDKEEDKPEDDGEDKEEDKPEDKAENKKVKNSMRDMVMGGSSNVQEQKLYISRKERLEEGNKY